MKITLRTQAPECLRYPTCGDWLFNKDGHLHVTVAEHEKNDRSAFLVALHEMVEAYLCKEAGIEEEAVSKWDIDNPALEEPGDHPDAPYHKEHMVATQVEKIVAEALGHDWNDHNDWVQAAGDAVEEALSD
jgi:hypothetical protein